MATLSNLTISPSNPVKIPLPCPRCESTNTKFCYYNNYSLSQPRHFCKSCKRYWTRGGTLRNVPAGGGSRKNHHHQSKRFRTSPDPAYHTPSNNVTIPPLPSSTSISNNIGFGSFNGLLGFGFGYEYPLMELQQNLRENVVVQSELNGVKLSANNNESSLQNWMSGECWLV